MSDNARRHRRRQRHGGAAVRPVRRHQPGNLGYNRWAFKPEVGLSRTFDRWTLEGYLGAWFFTTNDEHYPGKARKSQDPVLSLQGHVLRADPPRLGPRRDVVPRPFPSGLPTR